MTELVRGVAQGRHQASMSKTETFLACQWWAHPGVTLPPDKPVVDLSDAPRFGIAFHKGVELFLIGANVNVAEVADEHAVDAVRLKEYLTRAFRIIPEFLRRIKWDKREKLVEKKVFYDPFKDETRYATKTGTRDYSERKFTELPGTLDFGLLPSNESEEIVLVDWKTGQSTYDGDTNGQLRSLALALTDPKLGLTPFRRARVFIFKFDDDFADLAPGHPIEKTLEKHRRKLQRACRAVMGFSPAMYPGTYCDWCPANGLCPATHDPMFLADMGALYDSDTIRTQYTALMAAEKLLYKKRDEIHEAVKRSGPVQLDNGKWLQSLPASRENLSKASIRRALGAVRAEEVIAELRDRGAVELSEFEQLVQRAEPKEAKPKKWLANQEPKQLEAKK